MVSRIARGKRPQIVAELNGFSFELLVDPRPELDGFNCDAAVDVLPLDRRARAIAVCEEAGIPERLQRGVLSVICKLVEYQRVGTEVRTIKQDVDDLQQAVQMARDLVAKIDQLPANLKMALLVACREVVDEKWPEEWQRKYDEGCGLLTPVGLLAEGAEALVQAYDGAGATGGGRRPVLDHHGWHILDIWKVVESAGLTPGRGAFLKFCDGLFEVAGIPSKAEGAVKYFQANLMFVLPGHGDTDATMRMLDRLYPESSELSSDQKAGKNPARKRPK